MTRHLARVPAAPRRVLALIRVSKEKDETISPEVQRRAIDEYCAKRGYVVAGVVEGLDESGSQRRSAWWPRLDQAVAQVVSGDFDGVIVWKFSRTARHRLKWATALDRVETAGGVLESATEQFDTTTSAGRFARGMLAELNAFEAERIGETWKEAHAARVRSGRPHTGKARFGYTYDPATKTFHVNPAEGPILADMYRRYAAGSSVGSIVTWLNAQGHRTTLGNHWTDIAVRKCLESGFGAGKFRVRGELHDGIHDAVITPTEWQAYQDRRALRRQTPSRRSGSKQVLSGFVRCMRCGNSMVVYAPSARPERVNYRCGKCPQLGKGPSGYVAAWKVERVVLDYLRGIAADVEDRAGRATVVDLRVSASEREAQRLQSEVAKVERSLVRLAVSNAEDPLPDDVYKASRAEILERLAVLKASLEEAQLNTRRPGPDAAAAAGLVDGWETIPVEHRRDLLRSLIDCVLVRTGRPPALRVVEWHEAKP